MKITVRQLKSLIREAMMIAAPTARAGVPIHGVVDAYAGAEDAAVTSGRGAVRFAAVEKIAQNFNFAFRDSVNGSDAVPGGGLLYLEWVPTENELKRFFEAQQCVSSWKVAVAGSHVTADEHELDPAGPVIIFKMWR